MCGIVLCALTAVVCIMHHHTQQTALLSKSNNELWDRGYLWAKPGMGQNDDYTRAQSLVHSLETSVHQPVHKQQAHKKGMLFAAVPVAPVVHMIQSRGMMTKARQQSLCGTGAGCEIDSAFDVDFAEAHNYTGVTEGLITKEHLVKDDTVKEVSKAIEDYAHEVRKYNKLWHLNMAYEGCCCFTYIHAVQPQQSMCFVNDVCICICVCMCLYT